MVSLSRVRVSHSRAAHTMVKGPFNTNNIIMRSDVSRLSAGLAGGLRLSDHAPLPPARHGHLSTQSLPHSEGG